LVISPSVLQQSTVVATPDGTSSARESLLDHNGGGIAVILGALVVGSVAATLATGRPARMLRVGSGLVTFVFASVGMASIGLFYLPPAIMLVVAGYPTPSPSPETPGAP
jgi:hypothetical protein